MLRRIPAGRFLPCTSTDGSRVYMSMHSSEFLKREVSVQAPIQGLVWPPPPARTGAASLICSVKDPVRVVRKEEESFQVISGPIGPLSTATRSIVASVRQVALCTRTWYTRKTGMYKIENIMARIKSVFRSPVPLGREMYLSCWERRWEC